MFTRPRNWSLNSYTPSTETDFIEDEGNNGTIVQSIVLVVTGQGSPPIGAVNVRLVVTDDSNIKLFELLPSTEISATDGPQIIAARSIVLVNGQKIRVEADDASVEFYGAGIDDNTSP